MEVARGLQSLVNEHGYTHKALGGIIGKARSTVTELLSLNKLPSDIQEECISRPEISRSILTKIANTESEEEKRTLLDQAKAGNLSVAQVRAGRKKNVKNDARELVFIKSMDKMRKQLTKLKTEDIRKRDHVERVKLAIQETRDQLDKMLQELEATAETA